MLGFVEPNYRLPSTMHISALIRKDFKDGKQALLSQLYGCLPLLFGLCDAAKQEESDCVMLSGIKRRLIDQLNERFKLKSLDISSPIVLAAALVPRFCKLSFLSNSE